MWYIHWSKPWDFTAYTVLIDFFWNLVCSPNTWLRKSDMNIYYSIRLKFQIKRFVFSVSILYHHFYFFLFSFEMTRVMGSVIIAVIGCAVMVPTHWSQYLPSYLTMIGCKWIPSLMYILRINTRTTDCLYIFFYFFYNTLQCRFCPVMLL